MLNTNPKSNFSDQLTTCCLCLLAVNILTGRKRLTRLHSSNQQDTSELECSVCFGTEDESDAEELVKCSDCGVASKFEVKCVTTP